MALDRNNLVALMKTVAKAKPASPVAYSWDGKNLDYDTLNETLRMEMNELAGSYSLYRENKNLIFSIIEETLDDVLPKKVEEQYNKFAEVKTFKQGDKPIFRRKLNTRQRAKQFVTRVGHASMYEVFKLGVAEEAFEVRTSAIGGAAQVGFEEFLDGRVDFAEVTAIIMEGMDELIYKEIGAALKASINQLPPANRVAAAGFDEASFDRLLTIASAYGEPTIYCTYEFAVNMIPQEAWRYTESMKDELWRTGRLASYKGKKVIILEQGFEDGTNEKKVIDPGYAWIIPTGADGKPVKVAFEGNTIVDEYNNYDRSREIQVYKKVGVVCMMANNICAYVDTALMGQMDTWHLDGASNVAWQSNVVIGNDNP
nr:MAG TPA: major capsid protein [Caudoviricetes sp.]